jgi:hypothetical protein
MVDPNLERRDFLRAAAGAALSLPLRAADAPGVREITLTGGRLFTRFYFGDEWDKPFLYPLVTSSGIVVSRGFPVEPREGETTDHRWHRGIFFGHGIVNQQDFWREQGRQKTSCLVIQGAPEIRLGRREATLSAAFVMRPPAGGSLGTVRQTYRMEERKSVRLIDARITVAADAGIALTFSDTDDGGFAFRLADVFREDRGALLRNSEGLEGTKNIWGKSARWVDYSAVLGGRRAGVTMFDHPANLRHPTPWHARGYSLCSANPFGRRSFNPQAADGSHTIPAGEMLTLRYRVVIHEGAEKPAIEGWFAEFAKSGV